MPHWVLFNDWMQFEYLDENLGLTSAYTIGYRFTDDSTDPWTTRFNKFKAKKPAALCGGFKMMQVAVPHLIRKLQLESSRTVLVPALSSSETVASENGILSYVTRLCAKAATVGFSPDAITKKAHRPLHNFRNAESRRELLDNADYKSTKIQTENVLIIDDFITRGGTLSHIAQAIHNTNRNVRVYGVGLCKTERRSYQKSHFNIEISNDHVPTNWETLWKEGEEYYINKSG